MPFTSFPIPTTPVPVGSATQQGVVQVDGTSITASSGVISATGAGITYPLKAPDGAVSAPSYSWANETNSGFYRVTLHDIRYSINGVDVFRFADHVVDNGFGVAIGDQTTFFYPTGTTGGAANGRTLKTNRIQVGVEALQGTQGAQSPVSWVNTYQPAAMELASVGVTSQIGGFPIVAATRTSDWRTATSSSTGGSGSYFFALNDDTVAGAGGDPIASAMNNTAWRASGVTGLTQACQIDINNQGSVVDADPHQGDLPGETVGLNLTAGAFSNINSNASMAVKVGQGVNAKFRKCIVVFNNALDATVGAGGGGLFADLPVGATIRWVDGSGITQSEIWGNAILGFNINSPCFSKQFGYPTGSLIGGSVTQATSISTPVTINKICGQITTVNNAFTGGTLASFTVNNSLVAATDTVIVNGNPQGGIVYAANVSNGSFVLNIYPTFSGSATFAINFAIIKAANN